MPCQRIPVRPVVGVLRRWDPVASRLTFVELRTVPSANAQLRRNSQPEIGIDAEVSAVVETVDVGAQEKSVGDGMRAAIGKGSYVRGFETGKGGARRHSAAVLIGIGDGSLEVALAHSWADKDWRTVPRSLPLKTDSAEIWFPTKVYAGALLEYCKGVIHIVRVWTCVRLSQFVASVGNYVSWPPGGLWQLFTGIGEEDVPEDNAADSRIWIWQLGLPRAERLCSGKQLSLTGHAVCGAPDHPSLANSQLNILVEEAASYEVIPGNVESPELLRVFCFEQERLALRQGLEGVRRGLPEVGFSDLALVAKEGRPLVVGDTNDDLHGGSIYAIRGCRSDLNSIACIR